jgi:hypothetical protein
MPIAVTARLPHRPAHATLIYHYLYAGTVVSTRYPCAVKPTR